MYWKIPPRKSSTCFGRSGNPLSEYETIETARESAGYENARNADVKLIAYVCSKCGKFHLKPEQWYVPKLETECSCTDANGNKKDAYPTEDAAQKMVRIRSQFGVFLHTYRCPVGNGWHLTSHAF